jgi:pentatricopeptide repeat protein
MNPAHEYVKKAKELRYGRKYREAELLLEEGFEKYPKDIYIINNLIQTYGKYKTNKAIELFNYTRDLDIDDIVTNNIMLKIFANKKDKENAEEIYKYINENFEYENLAITLSSMLTLYTNLRDKEKGEEIFELIKKKGYEDYYSYNNMLNFYVKLGDYKKAENFFNKTIQKGHSNSITYSTIINMYFNTKEYEKALNVIKKVPYRFKDVPILVHEVELNRRLRNYYKCLNLIEDLLKFDNLKFSNRISIEINQAYCYKQLKDIEKAKTIFRNVYDKIEEYDPSYIRVITGLVFCGDVKKNEVSKFTYDLMKADRQRKGRGHAVKEALRLLSKMGNKDKIKNIERTPILNRKKKFNKH